MEETAEAYHYICAPFCFFRLSLLCFVLLVASLASTCLISFGFSTFLISLSVLVFLFHLVLTKKKRTLENSVQNEDLINDHENLLQRKLQPENGTITQNKAAQQNELDQIHPYHVGSLDFPPNGGSEDDTITSVDFELNWVCPNNVHWGPISSSDDDDDDDDNLIEISFPEKSIKNVKEELRQKPQQSKALKSLVCCWSKLDKVVETVTEVAEAVANGTSGSEKMGEPVAEKTEEVKDGEKEMEDVKDDEKIETHKMDIDQEGNGNQGN
ncbi:hypothetical protein F0562_008710 [Nyssa sinensis]|uniref:Uncharacterized protein n=1 Tax=Nyssa sinensis TaxID=561372 RepID=A0A5J5ACZ7_9ASTE|nr:hypothetical protein F0562_008710 [Nyssa sinensis]